MKYQDYLRLQLALATNAAVRLENGIGCTL